MFNDKGNRLDFEYIYRRLVEWGYGIHYVNKAVMKDMIIVKKEGRFIEEVSVNDVFEVVKKHAEEHFGDRNLSLLYENSTITNPSWYKRLPVFNVKKYKDSKDNINLFFKNCVVQVGKEEVKAIRYEHFDFGGYYIWKSDILDHEIDVNSARANFEQGDWFKFCSNAVAEGIEPLMKSLGYLVHSYKDPAQGKIVVFAESSLGIQANGGTGKSIIAYVALSKVRKVDYIGGDTFDPDRDFKFQTVDPFSNVIVIDDVEKRFKYKSLYNVATNVMTLERKHQGAINLEYTESPKIVVTTNYGILGQGDSDKRRRVVIGFTNHYSQKYTPADEFGRRFFEDWGWQDLNQFYGFFIASCQKYLNEGLEDYNSGLVDLKALIAVEGEDFVEWIKDNTSAFYGYANRKTWDGVLSEIPKDLHRDNSMKTKRSFKRVAESLGYEVREKLERFNGRVQRYKYLFKEGVEEISMKDEEGEELPF
jgi:hypothetical protein